MFSADGNEITSFDNDYRYDGYDSSSNDYDGYYNYYDDYVQFTATETGTFYIGVSSEDNTYYDPTYGDSGYGGSYYSAVGDYRLQLTTEQDAIDSSRTS